MEGPACTERKRLADHWITEKEINNLIDDGYVQKGTKTCENWKGELECRKT